MNDRAMVLAMFLGSAIGVPLALVTLNLGWLAGRLVDLHRVLEALPR